MKKNIFRCPALSQAGLTLVELLVAMVVGLILLTGIYNVFLTSDTGYRYNEQLARLQENGRFVVDLFAREIRMAGYMGCAGQTNSYSSVLDSSDFVYNFGDAVYGLNASGSGWVDDSGAVDPTDSSGSGLALSAPLSGSDILVIRGVDPNITIDVVGHMDNPSAKLEVTHDLDESVLSSGGGEILMVSDCNEAIVFQSTGYTKASGALIHDTGNNETPGNKDQKFNNLYAEDSEILIPRTVIYYLRNNEFAPIEPSLYRKTATANPEELIRGVESMQVLYGEDTDDDKNVDSYLTADSVSDWGNVLAVRIGLLIRSPNEIAKKNYDTATYSVNGSTIDPAGNGTTTAPVDDRRLRQVFMTTVGIRNRLP